MSIYLLPCACGRQARVSAAQSGQAIACGCGARLEVPSMRGLAVLAPADLATPQAERAWSDRHRVAFVLLLAAAAGAVTAGYMALGLRSDEAPVPQSDTEFGQDWEHVGAAQALALFDELKSGLPATSPREEERAAQRRIAWGAGLALAGSALAAMAAGALLLSRARRSGRRVQTIS